MDPARGLVLLVDASDTHRDMLAQRLRAQGYQVEGFADAAKCAEVALAVPPAAVVAELWPPRISGVQLCRLLRAEPATAEVPVILCGEGDDPRSRFWAERAGASAYVAKGRTGDLVRALSRLARAEDRGDFFVQLPGGQVDIQERLARHLDAALFESTLAAEIRSLASAASLSRLFDGLAQLLSQVTRYRWIALADEHRLAVHHHPAQRDEALRQVREALGDRDLVHCIEDEDAAAAAQGSLPEVHDVTFAEVRVGRFALAGCDVDRDDAAAIARIVARELGGAIKIASLVEESQRMALTDALTGLHNRRAIRTALETELSRARRYGHQLGLALFDLDHFKKINDSLGHATGDRALAAIGDLLRRHLRGSDLSARWGGEEFLVVFTDTDVIGARAAGERLRQAIESLRVEDDTGERVAVSASIGVTILSERDTVDALVQRADEAMYAAKAAGRNRVSVRERSTHVGTGTTNPTLNRAENAAVLGS